MRMGLLLACCIGGAGGVRSAEPELSRYEFESPHMGTTFRVVLYAADKPTAEKAAKAAFARVAELDRVLSDYNPNSELMKLCKANDAAPGKPVKVSDHLFEVLCKAEVISTLSDGAFDVTVGPVVKLWRLARRTQELPERTELADALAKVGYLKMKLDPEGKTVALAVAGMRLDLGGIGKGYAADHALHVLRNNGISHALVAASGDIVVGEPPPGKDRWIVDIAPLGKGMPARRLKLAHAAVSTSGDLFQFVEIGGVRYSHVLDPKTGLGLTGRRSVTVVAPYGWLADSLTKAASVLPPEKALPLMERMKAATYIAVKANDDAEMKVTESKGFKELVVNE